ATRRVTLDDVELALLRVRRLAVGELARQTARLEQALAAAREVARLASRDPRLRGLRRLGDHDLALARVALEPRGKPVVARLLHERLRLGVAELGLRLTLELRLGELHRDDRGKAFTDVIAREVVVLLLEDLLVARELVDHARQRRTEALLVCPALVGVDGV